jgi:hypothetical protein
MPSGGDSEGWRAAVGALRGKHHLSMIPGNGPDGHAKRPELPWEPVRVLGRGFRVGEHSLTLRGVTYGAFRPNGAGDPFPEPAQVTRDFAAMAAHGVNAVRVYNPPPRWLLDEARAAGLRVLAGLCWEQHVAFLENRAEVRARAEAIRLSLRATAGHPALLAIASGNEVPASIVRWYGRRRIAAWLGRLAERCREECPDTLVTYGS